MKKKYISPVTTWVWIGLDKKVADAGAGVNPTSNEGEIPDEGWAREEKRWQDEKAFQDYNKKVWDDEW